MLPTIYRETKSYCAKLMRLANPKFYSSVHRLNELKGKHKGQRAFIIGNGPSLKNMDLSILKDEKTFGLNRIYLLFDQIGFSSTYFVAINHLVIEQTAKEIVSKVPCPKIIDWGARKYFKLKDDIIYLKTYHEEPRFFTDITRGIWQGMTVTYVAMQVAYFMGFDQVILIGIDHSFRARGKPNEIVTSQDQDDNHFTPDYFGKGFRWQLPDLEGSELAYRMAKFQYERTGREIIDATVGGKLQVFRKVDYYSLFG
jgi:hypothetical protein